MNHLLLLAFLFGVTAAMRGVPTAQRGVPGRRIDVLALRVDATPPAPQTCGTKSGIVCGTDCSTQLLCAGVDKPVRNNTCAQLDASKPYCVGRVCSASPDVSNAECAKSSALAPFTCTSEGIFPEPTDCTKYRYCAAASEASEMYQCPDQTVFYSYYSACLPRAQAACYTVNCATATTPIVPYRGNPAYYAYCVKGDGVATQTLLFKCVDEQNEIFDPATNACVYNCKRVGNYVDRTDCTAYISCTWANGRWVSKQQKCPPKYAFKNGSCVRSSATCESEIAPIATEAPTTEATTATTV